LDFLCVTGVPLMSRLSVAIDASLDEALERAFSFDFALTDVTDARFPTY
jgi:hypothetical protein